MQILLRYKLYCCIIFIIFMFCSLAPVHAEIITVYDYDESGNIISKTSIDDGSLDDDGDGLSNAEEISNGTDRNNNDTDADAMPDGWEVLYGLDPLNNDMNGDADYDGASNYDEYLADTDAGTIQTDLVLANQTIITGNIKEYRATNSITAGPAYIVDNGADVSFKASNIIILKSGFKASEGSIFHAAIE